MPNFVGGTTLALCTEFLNKSKIVSFGYRDDDRLDLLQQEQYVCISCWGLQFQVEVVDSRELDGCIHSNSRLKRLFQIAHW